METRKKDILDNLDFDDEEKTEPKYRVDEEVLKEMDEFYSKSNEENDEEEDNNNENIDEDIDEDIDNDTNEEEHKEEPIKRHLKFSTILKCICLILLVGLCLFNLKHVFVRVTGTSMNPTYVNGQILLADRHPEEIKRYDVVVIDADNKLLIKRVIGLPGEHVVYKDNTLYINDEPKYDVKGFVGITSNFDVILNDGEYYCLGDNREVSQDSRYYGAFTKKQLIAKVR